MAICIKTGEYEKNIALVHQFPTIMSKLMAVRHISKAAYEELQNTPRQEGIFFLSEKTARKYYIAPVLPGINKKAIQFFLSQSVIITKSRNINITLLTDGLVVKPMLSIVGSMVYGMDLRMVLTTR